MEPFVTMGLVLKETRYREADRILTILTPKLGVITAMAANSLRLKSKLFSACGLFCYSEFTLVPGRNMYTVREADVQNIFHGISSSAEILCGRRKKNAGSAGHSPHERQQIQDLI